MLGREVPRWQRLLLVAAAGVLVGAYGAVVWRWGVPWRQAAANAPVRLTHLGGTESFLWSRTGARLLLLRRAEGSDAGRWIADYASGVVMRCDGSLPGQRADLAGEFGAPHPDRVAPHVTPDRQRVAAGYPSALSIVDVRTGRSRELLRAGVAPSSLVDTRWVFGPVWSPDARRLAFTALEARRRLPRSVVRRLHALAAGPAGSLADDLEAWSKLGIRVGLWVVDVDTGHARRVLDCGPFDPRDGLSRTRLWLQWSPDGRRVGFLRDGDVWAVAVPP